MKRLLSMLLGGWSLAVFAAGGDAQWEETLGVVKRGMRQADTADLAAAALEPLRATDQVAAVEYIITLVRKDRTPPAVARRAAEIMGGYKSAEVREFMLAYFQKHPLPDPFVLEAVAGMAVPGLEPAFLNIIGRRNATPGERALAVLALGEYGQLPDETVKLMLDKMKNDESPVIQRFAAEALGGVRSKLVIPALIEGLPDKLIGEKCEDSLRRLTGENLGKKKDEWVKWWQENGEKCELKATPLKEFRKLKEQELAAQGPGDQPQDFASFYGMRVDGKNVLFVLDRSGSMNESSPPRIETLKIELREMLEKMEPDVSFGIVLFGPVYAYPNKGIELATAKFKERTQKFIPKIYAAGGTPLTTAMEYAFKELVEKYNIDTIFLLSDGDPTDATPEECRDRIYRLNMHRYVTIHTISIGQESKLMEQIAGDHNGNYCVR